MDKIKVLLVEDEQTLAMIIKDTLEGQNFIIHTAADGEEGLRMFFDLRPDVLVADVRRNLPAAKKNLFHQLEISFLCSPM